MAEKKREKRRVVVEVLRRVGRGQLEPRGSMVAVYEDGRRGGFVTTKPELVRVFGKTGT